MSVKNFNSYDDSFDGLTPPPAKKDPKIPYPDIYESDGIVYQDKEDKEGNVTPQAFGRAFRLLRHVENVEDGTYHYQVCNREDSTPFKIPRETLNKRDFLQFAKYGLDIFDWSVNVMIKFLLNIAATIMLTLVHTGLGFGKFKRQLVYKHQFILSANKKYNSRYEGVKNISAKGTLNEWLKMIENDVIGYTPLEFGLVAGFAAVIVGLVGDKLDTGTVIIHLFGGSTTGKTTLTRLSVSPFGLPDIKDSGLISSFNATSNAIIHAFIGNYGVPIVLDDASNSELTVFGSLTYRIASGREKDKLTKESILRNAETWQTVILTNGEFSLLEKCGSRNGIRVRLIEFGDVNWTIDADRANRIRNTVLDNYGHAWEPFVKKVLEYGHAKIYDLCKQYSRKLQDSLPMTDEYTERICNKLATILTAAEVVNAAFDFKVDIAKLTEFVLSSQNGAVEERNMPQKIYDYLIELFSRNSAKFIKVHGRNILTGNVGAECWGKQATIKKTINGKDKTFVEYSVFPRIVEDALERAGFESLKGNFAKLRDKGLLLCDAGHLTRKKQIEGSVKQRMYVFLAEQGDTSPQKRGKVTDIDDCDGLFADIEKHLSDDDSDSDDDAEDTEQPDALEQFRKKPNLG